MDTNVKITDGWNAMQIEATIKLTPAKGINETETKDYARELAKQIRDAANQMDFDEGEPPTGYILLVAIADELEGN